MAVACVRLPCGSGKVHLPPVHTSVQSPCRMRSPAGNEMLCDDVLAVVFSFLTLPEQMRMMLVCKRFRRVVAAMHARRRRLAAPRWIDDAGIVALARSWTRVESIDLENCSAVTDLGVAAIGQAGRLRRVNLGGVVFAMDAGVASLAAANANLRELCLGGCNDVTSHALHAIGKHCAGLRALDVSFCARIGSDGIEAVAVGCPELGSLNLSFCANVTPTGLATLLRSCRALTVLDISSNAWVGDNVCGVLADHPSLERLNLSACGLTDIGAAALARSTTLTSINLFACPSISEAGHAALEAAGIEIAW